MAGGLQAHGQRLVVARLRADVPVLVGHGHQGADVHAGVLSVEEEPQHVAVQADARAPSAQRAFVLHGLRVGGKKERKVKGQAYKK